MVTFITLILGLTTGQKLIEVAVDDSVVAVEMRLDAKSIGRREEPPWEFMVDLGPILRPHRLIAIGLDANGRELDRAVQWLNLPHPPADARVLITPATADEPAYASLSWESLAGAEPREVMVTLDGQTVEVADPHRFPLPPYDLAQLHFLRAELVFSENVRSVVEVTLGGTYTDQVSSELTAIPVLATGRAGRALEEAKQQQWFHGRDATGATIPLQVVAVDRGPPIVVLVPDRGAQVDLRRMLDKAPVVPGLPMESRALAAARGRLAHGQRARVLWPVTRSQEAVANRYDLFLNSSDVAADEAGFAFLMAENPIPVEVAQQPQRLVDAVAVAGLEAASRRRPRAVVLLLGGDPEDHSFLSPAAVRRYLSEINTPLHVWTTSRRPGPGVTAWGPFERVTSLAKLDQHTRVLGKALRRQWVVWLNGRHLPQDVHLAPTAQGLEIVR